MASAVTSRNASSSSSAGGLYHHHHDHHHSVGGAKIVVTDSGTTGAGHQSTKDRLLLVTSTTCTAAASGAGDGDAAADSGGAAAAAAHTQHQHQSMYVPSRYARRPLHRSPLHALMVAGCILFCLRHMWALYAISNDQHAIIQQAVHFRRPWWIFGHFGGSSGIDMNDFQWRAMSDNSPVLLVVMVVVVSISRGIRYKYPLLNNRGGVGGGGGGGVGKGSSSSSSSPLSPPPPIVCAAGPIEMATMKKGPTAAAVGGHAMRSADTTCISTGRTTADETTTKPAAGDAASVQLIPPPSATTRSSSTSLPPPLSLIASVYYSPTTVSSISSNSPRAAGSSTTTTTTTVITTPLAYFHMIAGLIYVTALHGPRVLFMFGFVLANFYVIAPLCRRMQRRRGWWLALLWSFHVGVLFANEWYHGYSLTAVFSPLFSGVSYIFGGGGVELVSSSSSSAASSSPSPPSLLLAWLETLPQLLRWNVIFNMSTLRMIAYCIDYEEAYRRGLVAGGGSEGGADGGAPLKKGVLGGGGSSSHATVVVSVVDQGAAVGGEATHMHRPTPSSPSCAAASSSAYPSASSSSAYPLWCIRLDEKHRTMCLDCARTHSPCYRLRTEVSRPLRCAVSGGSSSNCSSFSSLSPPPSSDYNLVHYLAYLFYVPLYIAGPMSSFNAYVSHLYSPQRWFTAKGMGAPLRYAARTVCYIFLLVGMLHFEHILVLKYIPDIYAVAQERIGADIRPALFIHTLGFLWLKFAVIWRIFRLVALLDGFDVPEDMLKPFCSATTIANFWRDWHSSFNIWIIRYMYIPLGGNRFKVLAIIPIFLFIAIWHDIELQLLSWALLMCLIFVPETIVTTYFGQKRFDWLRDKSYYFVLRAFGTTLTLFALIVFNLVGYGTGQSSTRDARDMIASISFDGKLFLIFLPIGAFVNWRSRDVQHEAERRERWELGLPIDTSENLKSEAQLLCVP